MVALFNYHYHDGMRDSYSWHVLLPLSTFMMHTPFAVCNYTID